VSGDVDATSLWYDAPNTGIFDPTVDVLVGTGTFGDYQGLPLVSQIVMFNPLHVVTSALASQPQRYFVAYHINPTAQPTDPLTQAPRTLGVTILPTSLPTNSPINDNVFLNALSLPNFYDTTSPLPMSSKLRAIIPSPQIMQVRATPYFSTSSGTFPAPYLTAPINTTPVAGTIEPFWLVSSTQGLPSPSAGTTDYLIVDGEVVGYLGFGAAPGVIQNVIRGALNTVPAVHFGGVSSGAAVSPQVEQGQTNLAGMRLDLWSQEPDGSPGFQVQLASLDMTRLLPIGMNGADTDLTAIRVFRTNDGTFHRDPLTGLNISDTILGTSDFGAPPETPGRVLIPINDPSIGNPGYTLITSTPTSLYVAFDVSPSAKFSYPTLNPPNEVTGFSVLNDPTRFQLTPANAGHTSVFIGTSAVASPTFVLAPTVNTVSIVMTQLSGNTALQNQPNVPMLRMTMSTDRNSAIVQKLRFDRTGSPSSLDSDITTIKVWADSNGNNIFDASDSTVVAGSNPYLLSFGNETFSTGTVNFTLRKPILVTTTPASYFVTYDISQFAATGNQEGVALPNPSYVTPQVPNVVGPIAAFASNPQLTISKVVSNVTLGVNDLAAGIPGVSQAQANVGVLRFNLASDIALAPWRSLRVERGGGSQDPLKPLGRNTDVKFVRIYKDINQNDILDGADLNISEVNTTLVGVSSGPTGLIFTAGISSTTGVPFDMVVASTAGFPVDNQGNAIPGWIYMNNAELMSFSGPGCQTSFTPGVDDTTGKPCLRIAARGQQLGTAATPTLSLSAGVNARKVDIFDQNNDANVQNVVTLNTDQLIGPTAQSFFVAYDIGDAAVANDLVNVTIRSATWIGMPAGDNVATTLDLGVTRANPLGTGTTTYPFVGSNVAIAPLTLKVGGFSNAPNGAGQGDTNVPILELNMQSSQDFVNVASMRIKQLGTVATSSVAQTGDGDASVIKIWLDNGTGVFSPSADQLIGQLSFSTSGPFSNGTALVPLTVNGIPYLTVSTAPVTVFVTADIGFNDQLGNSTLNQTLGFQLQNFADLLAPNGAPIVASADPVLQPPVASKTVLIAPLTVPAVSISSALPPIIVTRAGPNVPGLGVGQPAYAKLDPIACNNGKDPTNPRNNICLDANSNPIPDQTKWICPDGSPYCQVGTGTGGSACLSQCANPPLIDINGDGRPDNFSVGQSTIPNQVSLLGDGTPTTDLTGQGILDVDINKDGIPDLVVFAAGSIKPQFRIGLDPSDVGNLAKTAPDPGQGLAPTSWSPSAGQLNFNLPMVGTSGFYLVSVGKYYDDPIGITHKWSSVTVNGSVISGYGVRAVAAPVTAAAVGNLTLNVPNVARLTVALTQNTTSFTVDNAAPILQSLNQNNGLIYVGSEIMRVKSGGGNQLLVITQPGDPPPFNGRGLHGSAPIIHTVNELVSDSAAILFAQYVEASGAVSPPQAMFVYRVDPLAPTTPGAASPLQQGQTSFTVQWSSSTQFVSGVAQYEVQERGGDPKDLSATIVWRTINIIPGASPKYIVGAPQFPGEGPRAPGEFFTYRVRAISGAGVASNWSPTAAAANTGLTASIISGVSNFPNPFDTRKGGPAGKTQITYTLNADSDVTIQIYDELGYLTKTIGCPAGSQGGSAGMNFVQWDGHNDAGISVSKGGYIARIRVKSPGGAATAIRKIGVIH